MTAIPFELHTLKRLRALDFLHYLPLETKKTKQVVCFQLNDAMQSDRIARAHV